MNSTFSQSPSYYQVSINGNSNQEVWITDDGDIREQKNIVAMNYPLKMGDLIVWKDKKWLCNHVDDMEIYHRGVMLICYSTLKWLDDQGEIQETPFSFKSDTSSNFGIQEGRILMMPNERRQITVQKNDQTERIKKNRRFIIDGRAWKTVGINRLIDGLINLTLEEQDLIPADNLELEIADYIGNIADYQLKVLNVKDIVAIEENQTLQLSIELTNNSKVIEVDEQITYSVADENILSVSPTGLVTPLKKGISKITISFRNISQTIQVNVTSSTTNNYTAHITGDEFIKYNMTKSFTCSFKDNGIDRQEKAHFWLTEIDGLTTTLASIIEQDGQVCKIKANNKKGRVILHVENSTSLAYTKKEIEIKSLL
ncbi:Ig-like domain-containing protein [Paenibacillus jamilae]|uniref:Ig-like domain-containing protein n=1 Tax=Paenibacillus jamilae TaxID=114136 RepID=UPI0018D2A75C|nr:Ig-like domain-containing protein [Paenibacillus jamilae]